MHFFREKFFSLFLCYNKNMTENKYGNVSLGQIVRFLVAVCGKDALLSSYITEAELDDAYKEKGSYLKFKYTDENSIFKKIKKSFTDLETEFSLPLLKIVQKKTLDGSYLEEVEESEITAFYFGIIWEYIVQIAEAGTFENTQNNWSKYIIYRFILRIYFNENFYEALKKELKLQFIDYINECRKHSYEAIFQHLKENSASSFEKLYSDIAVFLPESEKDAVQYVARAIQKSRKNNTNLSWNVLYACLKYSKNDAEIVLRFLNLYFYTNSKNAIEHLSLKKSDWNALEQFCEKHSDGEAIPFSEIDSFLNKNVNMNNIVAIHKYINLIPCDNTRKNIDDFFAQLDTLNAELPHSICFWEAWFSAKKSVLSFLDSCELEKLAQAVKLYLTALDKGKYFAGKMLNEFVQEAVSVSQYYEWKKNPVQMRDLIRDCSASTSATKTPLDKNTKKLYDFGIAFDAFLNEMSDAFQLYYFRCHNFWNRFPAENENARELKKRDLIEESGVIDSNNISEKDFVFKSKESLEKITDGKINALLSTTHKVAYTPISTAIMEEQYDIVRLYLDKTKYPSLDLNVPNTNNTFPLHELMTQYACHHKAEERELIFQFLERTDKETLKSQTNRQKISFLQKTIHTLDIEVISAVANKMTANGTFPGDFRISADEMSPLYYALNIKYQICSLSKFFGKMEIGNINYKNLFAPGFSAAEKEICESPEFSKIMEEMIRNKPQDVLALQHIVPNCSPEEAEKRMEQIIDFLITKTENVDDFVLYSMREAVVNNQGCNALLYACEYDDVSTCRKLIEAGANMRTAIGIASHDLPTPSGEPVLMPNNFILRAIHFCSWNCLEMFLSEYKAVAFEYMHRKEENMTPLVFFLVKLHFSDIKPYEKRQLVARFLPLFQEAGADVTEQTVCGSASEVLRLGF